MSVLSAGVMMLHPLREHVGTSVTSNKKVILGLINPSMQKSRTEKVCKTKGSFIGPFLIKRLSCTKQLNSEKTTSWLASSRTASLMVFVLLHLNWSTIVLFTGS